MELANRVGLATATEEISEPLVKRPTELIALRSSLQPGKVLTAKKYSGRIGRQPHDQGW